MNFIYLLGMFLAVALCGGDARAESAVPGLFDEDSVLELSFQVDFDELCRPRETPDCDYTPSVLQYMEGDEQHSIPIEIRIRGGWRSLSSNCNVPLLFLHFPDQETQGTPFEGQKSLPLTTHCGRTNPLTDLASGKHYLNYEQYLLKEYMAYRLYNELSDMSLRVRLLKVRYENPDKPGHGPRHYAFFTEHFESLALRSESALLTRGSFDHEVLDLGTADMVALFQFMIGNTDWSIVRQRNTILLQGENGVQVPVPYDLDMSGLVDAPYAGPPPTLPIEEVTQRYYLGFCHPDIDWDSLFNEFLSRQEAMLAQPGKIPGLYKKERVLAKRYLQKFFKVLHSSNKREDQIVNACQPWPPSSVDHMSLEQMTR